MKSLTTFAMLVLANMAWIGQASAQEYNLRTVPSNPPAGLSFLAAFDSTDCEAWVLPPLGEPPVVSVEGSTVHLAVDRITIENCSFPGRVHTLSVPALPVGEYQLELTARAYQSPGNDIFAQAVNFSVGPAVAAGTFSVPANNKVALAISIGLMLSLGYTLSRKSE